MKTASKKIQALLLVAALALTLFPVTALAADGTITESGTYNLSDYGDGSAIAINSGLTVTLTGDTATTYTNLRIVCAQGVSLTLNNVNINNSAVLDSCALSFAGAGITLALVGESTLLSGENQPGVKVESGTELTIEGSDTDKLTATGGRDAAGIGGGDGGSGGVITIEGGTVTATGGVSGAGIGGGYHGGGGTITIEGGTVTATSSSGAAGIGGGGGYGDGGTIDIRGGTVTANGGLNGAGIGGGWGGSGGNITINDGTVKATGRSFGAGIGGGYNGDGGTIDIRGGTVTANGGGTGAGIGGGQYSDGGTVTISGGTVTATGGQDGAGIGGGGGLSLSGDVGGGGVITISGGTVTAKGGRNSAGIGGGARSSGVDGGIGGTVTISGGSVYAIGNGSAANIGGGAEATDNGTLKNEGSDDVYLTTIQLLGSGAGKAAVSSLTTDLTYEYDVNDVFSDNLGWLYLYLPLGTETTQVVTSTGTFTGGAVTEDSPTAFYFAAGGADGREIELRNNGTAIQWRYVGETAWNDLVTLAALTGADGADGTDGREIEIRVDGGYIQWRYIGDASWNNIVALSAITGPQGPAGENGTDGREIELRNNGTALQWRYAGETVWNDLVSLAALTGTDGTDGREIEMRVDGGYIQWRYVEGSWNNLMAVSVVAGPQGEQGVAGANGTDGIDGRDGSDGLDGANGQNGKDGRNGKDGNGIVSIIKTGSEGNVDTYTISFTDGTSTTFTVTNGKDGVGVASATFNENGELVFTLTDGTVINLGPLPGGSVPASGTVSGERDGMGTAVPIALGAAALLSAQLWWLLPLLRRKIFKL